MQNIMKGLFPTPTVVEELGLTSRAEESNKGLQDIYATRNGHLFGKKSMR